MGDNNKKIVKRQDGLKYFKDTIQEKYPDLTPKEIKPLEDEIFFRMGKYISKGYMPAVVKPKRDGSLDVIVLYFEEIKIKLGKKEGKK